MNQLSKTCAAEHPVALSREVLLSQSGYLRLSAVLKLYPISKSSWWQGVREGRLPSGIKLGPRTTAWRVEDIRSLLGSISAGVQPNFSSNGDVQSGALK